MDPVIRAVSRASPAASRFTPGQKNARPDHSVDVYRADGKFDCGVTVRGVGWQAAANAPAKGDDQHDA
jgi:hypothetical protein